MTPQQRAEAIANEFFANIEQYAHPKQMDDDRKTLIAKIVAALEERNQGG